MKKLSTVFEGRLGRIMTSSENQGVRKEDDLSVISNIKEINPIDIGSNNVVWSDKNLIVQGNVYFNWEEWHDFEYDGWRIPTYDDIEELQTLSNENHDRYYPVKMLSRKSGKLFQIQMPNGAKLEFPILGYLNTKYGTIWGETWAVFMTSKETEMIYHGCTDSFYVSQISTKSIVNYVYGKYNHVQIRLVKNK